MVIRKNEKINSIHPGKDGNVIAKAYFISPIVNMERLILDMIGWADGAFGMLEEDQMDCSILAYFGRGI